MLGLPLLLLGIIWTLGLWLVKIFKCIKICILDHTKRSKGDNDLDNGMKYQEPAQDVSVKILVCCLDIILVIFCCRK